MKTITTALLAIFAVTGTLSAQGDPAAKARADLDKAVADLGETQREYSELRRALYRDINKLDDEALKLSRELRELEREEANRNADKARLEREVEARKTDFEYASGILAQYAKSFATRIHPAENQIYQQTLGEIEQKAATSAVPADEIRERVMALDLGIQRLASNAGGHSFKGRVLRNGGESIPGTLLIAGPSAFFAADDGNFQGVATFADSGTELPTVVALKTGGETIATTLSSGSGNLPFDGTMGKAIEVAAAEETLMDTIKKGGMVGHAILVLGAIAVAIAVYKAISLATFHVPSRRTLNEILDALLHGDTAAAAAQAAKIPGPAGALVRTGVENFHQKRRVLEEALFEKLVTIKPALESYLPFLGLTAAAGPLMGLLGTVLGIIKTFQAMALYGTGNAKSFSAGISEALITTAEGLIVAIPVLVIHGILKSFVRSKFSEVEAIGIAIMNGTSERLPDAKPNDKPSREDDHGGEDDDVELIPNSI
jgi:biopolymer transport protein ExbB